MPHRGTVRANAPTKRGGREALALAHAETLQTSQSIPLFQFTTRRDPPRSDDVCAAKSRETGGRPLRQQQGRE